MVTSFVCLPEVQQPVLLEYLGKSAVNLTLDGNEYQFKSSIPAKFAEWMPKVTCNFAGKDVRSNKNWLTLSRCTDFNEGIKQIIESYTKC